MHSSYSNLYECRFQETKLNPKEAVFLRTRRKTANNRLVDTATHKGYHTQSRLLDLLSGVHLKGTSTFLLYVGPYKLSYTRIALENTLHTSQQQDGGVQMLSLQTPRLKQLAQVRWAARKKDGKICTHPKVKSENRAQTSTLSLKIQNKLSLQIV